LDAGSIAGRKEKDKVRKEEKKGKKKKEGGGEPDEGNSVFVSQQQIHYLLSNAA
jgi:hypothetical protein